MAPIAAAQRRADRRHPAGAGDDGLADFARRLDAFQRDGYTVQRGSADAVDFELNATAAPCWCARALEVGPHRAGSAAPLRTAREAKEAPDALYIGLGELTDNARPFAAEHRIAIWRAEELAQALRGLMAGLPGLASGLMLAALAGAMSAPRTALAAAHVNRIDAAILRAGLGGDL